MSAALEKVNGTAVASAEPRFDPVALAEAERVRKLADAEVEARRIEAEGRAEAEKIKAVEEAERLRLANESKAIRLQRERAVEDAKIAEAEAKKAAAQAAAQKALKAAEEEAQAEADHAAEQQRAEQLWKWGARGIYAVGLIIAAPVQFLHFWDPARKFLVAAPALLEGLALVLAMGAAWAVAHRRDALPYRVGIMLGALVAAVINLHGGMTKPEIGFNAGLIGAIASIGGPVVLMAYEHGIAQKADGVPSRRERRAAKRAKVREEKARVKAKAEKAAAEEKTAAEKAAREKAVEEEQQRKDDDRREHHPDVWRVADAIRSARGSAVVTEQIWAEAWYRETGSKVVGIDPEIEARSRAAQARMKTVAETPVVGPLSLVDSQKGHRAKRDPDAPDGRRFNGGVPPRRMPGDTEPYSQLAKRQAAIEQAPTAAKKGDTESPAGGAA